MRVLRATTFFTCFAIAASVLAQDRKPDVTFDVPDKDRACFSEGESFDSEWWVCLGSEDGKLGHGLAWRSDVLDRTVRAEGIAWFGRVVMHGTDIRIRGCEFKKEDRGKLVRVVGTLRYDQGAWSRFGTVPPFFYIKADSYQVIERVKHPVLACFDKNVKPIKVKLNEPKVVPEQPQPSE